MRDITLSYLFRIFWALFLGFMLVYSFRKSWNIEHGRKKPSPDAPGNGIVILQDPLTLPFLCIVYIFLLVLLYGMDASGYVFSFGFDLFCFITVYFPLLLFLLPFLRNRYTARTCATLWLIPVFLFYQPIYIYLGSLLPTQPAFYIPQPAVTLLFFVWLTGFAITLLLQILSHLYFYRTLKISSHPVSDPHLLQLWEEMTRDIGIYDLTHPLRLCYSSRIHTPLSIGMCQRSLITCLPERSFDKEEAELIFSHELHHIQRHDTHTKFFLGLCRALGWFHPLVWMAIRKAEDDLELSCDEIVLRNADERKRKKYASLLLTIAGDARGYTTCLSSSAKTLRYRLKAVMPGKEKHLGLCLLLFTMITSFLCIGNIALTTKRGTVTEVTGIENTAVRNAAFLPADQNKTDQEIPIDDTEALSDYLKQLTIEKPLTAYNEKTLSLNKPALRGSFSDTGSFFMLYDHSLSIHDSDKSRTEWYHVRTPVDWEYILSL